MFFVYGLHFIERFAVFFKKERRLSMKQWKRFIIILLCFFLLCSCQSKQVSEMQQKTTNAQQKHHPLISISPQEYVEFVQGDCTVTPEELEKNPAYQFLGTWKAIRYIETGNIHRGQDEKNEGNQIYLGKHSYYNDLYSDLDIPLDRVEIYYIEKESRIDVEIYHKAFFDEVIPIEQEEIVVLYSKNENSEYEDLLGIILDENHMISSGGTCWFEYERVEV